jgi:hypothetical protein
MMKKDGLQTILVADDSPGERELIRLTIADLKIEAQCLGGDGFGLSRLSQARGAVRQCCAT